MENPKWLLTGNRAISAQKQEAKEIERRRNRIFDFYLKPDESAKITFLDGKLNSDKLLVPVSVWMHTVKQGSRFEDFVCLQAAEETCPICESGHNKFLARLFTVIDHRANKDRNGKVHKNEKKLLVAKDRSSKYFQKLASDLGRLRFISFEVTRTSDTDPRVGNHYTVIKQWQNPKDFMNKFKLKKEQVMPANYEEVLNFVPAEELRARGFGHGGHAESYGGGGKASSTDDFDDDF